MAKTLTIEDFCKAAKKLRCEVAAIRAVAKVESAGGGFLKPDENGLEKPKILFERHHFSRLTKRRFDADHPDISNAKPGGYAGGEKEWSRFNRAFALDPKAAMMSASWGKFQIMGFNFGLCGFSSVDDFVDAMKISEGEQLDAFCEFVITNDLDDELRRRDWAGFARGYNGKNYKINRYDEKMADYYEDFKLLKVNCQQFEKPEELSDLSDSNQSAESSAEVDILSDAPVVRQATLSDQPSNATAPSVQTDNQQDVNQPAEVQGLQTYNGIGFWSTIKRDMGVVFGGYSITEIGQTVLEKAGQIPEWLVPVVTKLGTLIAICGVGYLLFRVIHYVVDTRKQMQRVQIESDLMTDTNRRDIKWVE